MATKTAAEPDEDLSISETIREWLKEANKAHTEWRDEAKEAYGFRAGHQWADDDLTTLRDQSRPVTTFNRTDPILDTIEGMEINNRQETTFLPRGQEDGPQAEMLAATAEWARDECGAEDEESEAFGDMLTCGLGVTETRPDYDMDPEGRVIEERVDPLEMLWDPSAKKRNLTDARYVIRVRDIPIDWAKETWPEKEDEIDAGKPWQAREDDNFVFIDENTPGDGYKQADGKTGDSLKDMVRVVECQWRERITRYQVKNPADGEILTMSPDEVKALKERMPHIPQIPGVNPGQPPITFDQLDMAPVKEVLWMRAFLTGDILLELKACPDPSSSTYKFMTGKRDRTKNCFYGVVRAMKDPQQWANKWLSQIMHLINKGAKSGVIIEADAVEDPKKFAETWADSSEVSVMEPGAIAGGKFAPKPPMQYPEGIDRLMQFALVTLKDVTGVDVNIEGKGAGTAPQSGYQEYLRRQAAMNVLAKYFNALRHFRKSQGRLLLNLLLKYLPPGTMVRIKNPAQGQQQYQPFIPPDVAKYDVIVEETPSSPNQKDRNWQVLSAMGPFLVEMVRGGMPLPVVLTVLEQLPVPDSFIAKLKEVLQPQPNPMAEKQQQLMIAGLEGEVQKTAAETEKTRADAARSLADAQAKQRDTGVGEMKAQAEVQRAQSDLAQSQQLSPDKAVDAKKAELEHQQAILEHEMKLEQMKLEREKMRLEHAKIMAEMANLDSQSALKQTEVSMRERELTAPRPEAAPKQGAMSGDPGMKDFAAALTMFSGGMQRFAESVQDLSQAVKAPRKIDRDPASGRPIGVSVG